MEGTWHVGMDGWKGKGNGIKLMLPYIIQDGLSCLSSLRYLRFRLINVRQISQNFESIRK